MITTCPQCQTAFQISAEQLSAKAGLVRCGACRQVFNGYHALTIEPAKAGMGPASPPPAQMAVEATARDALLAPLERADLSAIAQAEALLLDDASGADEKLEPERWRDTASLDSMLAQTPEPSVPPKPVDDARGRRRARQIQAEVRTGSVGEAPKQGGAQEGTRLRAESDAREDKTRAPREADKARVARGEVEARAARGDAEARAARGDAEARAARVRAEPLYQPDLHQSAQSPAIWIGGALLLAGALLQATILWRGAIAQQWPQSRALLESMCAPLACEVPYARALAQLNIESSTLEADPARPGVMVLQANLQNLAPFVQHYPHLELTLTGVNDEALAVRAFAPSEYLKAVGAGWAPQQSHAVTLHLDAGALAPAGFRLRLIYP
jgi:predicted Zn finger-like uncharacterized protein